MQPEEAGVAVESDNVKRGLSGKNTAQVEKGGGGRRSANKKGGTKIELAELKGGEDIG